jgi:hypothetical protein
MSYNGNYAIPNQDLSFQNHQGTTPAKRHKCQFCNYSSDRLGNVRRHVEIKHPGMNIIRKQSNSLSHNGEQRNIIYQPGMHREEQDFQRNYNQNNQSIEYNLQKEDYEDTCDKGTYENNEKDVYLRLLSCGNCLFQTFSVEEMTKHKESMHGIIWSGKEYAKKATEDKDLESNEEEGEEDDVTKNRLKNGYKLWDLQMDK